MPERDIVVVGASAGGVEALRELTRHLPADLPAAVFVVLHLPGASTSILPSLMDRWGPLKAARAEDHEPIEHGRIYVARPDYHLLVKSGHIRLSRGPKENGHRPAVDPLFRTAARAYGPRVIGVVLSGLLDDGTTGLAAIKMRGGMAVVQDPEDALFSSMPESALNHVAIDHVCPAAGISRVLSRLVREPIQQTGPTPMPAEMEKEADMAELEPETVHDPHRPGTPSAFACPDCGGALFEIHDGQLIHYRCRVGHAYSPETLLAEQSDALEEALWTALRALEESAALSAQIATRARKRSANRLAGSLDERSRKAREQAELIRGVLSNGVFRPAPQTTGAGAGPDEPPFPQASPSPGQPGS